ncbi:MAG: LysR family transcriptional regulator [Cyclobacteriaceae bacterium]|nr:LysR family transcriptional regulator [Cyclobacteriaceae bacterium]MCH8515190.1 LysR family transcriptional regulator [Cyclobacteriaceae bacterium]
MTITQLEYVLAVNVHRHFAKAANACFITQPTLSMQINKLEDELGVLIFDRSRQPVRPTALGEKIIEQAKRVVAESKKIKEVIEMEKEEVNGNLHIGIIPTLAPYLLPLFISNFIKKYPAVNLQIEEMQTQDIIKKLKDDQLDIGLLVTPLNEKGIIEKPLFLETFYAYTAENNDLYKKSRIKGDEVDPEEMWILSDGHCFRNQMLNICNPNNNSGSGTFKHLKYESNSLESLKRMVDKHGGYTLLPQLATIDMSKEDQKKIRPFEEPMPVREVSMVVHRSFLKQKLVESLKKEILDALPPVMVDNSGDVIYWKKF